MNYKEKLNIAKEALESDSYDRKTIEHIFPELIESEDEKFLKYIIDCCKETIKSDDHGLELSMGTTKRLLAWLEKQGEQKPTETTDIRMWKYIVDAVLTEREGIGQYIDSSWTIKIAEKLQNRFGNIEQKPIEWNEEDETNRDLVYNALNLAYDMKYNKKLSIWFNNRCSQKQWKPSKKQITALSIAVKYGKTDDPDALKELFEQLKEL